MRITLAGQCTDTALPILRRDRLLEGDNNGVRYLWDLASRFCYDGLTPANAKPVVDIAERANGQVTIASGQNVGFAGNGLDFSTLTSASTGSFLRIPASVAADIWGNGTDAQHWLVAMYLRLPLLADWNPTAAIVAMLAFSDASNGFTSDADLVTMGQSANTSPGTLTVRRQTAVGTVSLLTITPAAGDYGGLAQFAAWRTASGIAARLRTANGTILQTGAAGANNSANFAAKTGKAGHGPSFVPSNIVAARWRLYRGWVENLRTSGRDPATVLDADWARVSSRPASTAFT